MYIYSKLEFLSCMNIIIRFHISRPTSVQIFFSISISDPLCYFVENVRKQLCTAFGAFTCISTLTSQNENIPKICSTTPKNVQCTSNYQNYTGFRAFNQSSGHRRDYEKLNTLNINTGSSQQIKLNFVVSFAVHTIRPGRCQASMLFDNSQS